MTGSRVSHLQAAGMRFGAGLLVGLCLGVLCLVGYGLAVLGSTPAMAQVGAPIQIGPPPTDPGRDAAAPLVPAPSRETAPGAAPGASVFQPVPAQPVRPPQRTTVDGAITINPVQRLTVDATGTLTPTTGGLPAEYWSGTPGDVALRLVALMPAAPESRTLRELARRMLLSAGPAPADLAKEGDLLARRAEQLLAMGAVDDLTRLGERVPSAALSIDLSRPLVEAAFVRGDDERACALYDRLTNASTDIFWIKVAMVCDARAGLDAKVDFGARLLSELGEEDQLIQALAQAATTGQGGAQFRMVGAGPVHLALARIADLKVDPEVSAIASLPVLVGLARGSASPPFAARLEAAERAERAGAIAPWELTDLYDEVSVSTASVEAALAAAEADPGPLGRAILWRVAEAQTDPSARARAIAKAMDLAEDDAAWRQTARLFAPFLLSLDPGPDLDAFAATAVRGLMATGDVGAARPWLQRLLRQSANGSDGAAGTWLGLWALSRIAGGDDVTPFDLQAVGRWWQHLRTIDPQQASVRASAALALMAALGDPVGDDAWRGLVAAPPVEVQAVPGAAYAYAIRAAGQNRRLGETVALGAAALGEVALAEIAVPALADVVSALGSVGLEGEARRLAVEVALAHGL